VAFWNNGCIGPEFKQEQTERTEKNVSGIDSNGAV
jgi:hypothetical protein